MRRWRWFPELCFSFRRRDLEFLGQKFIVHQCLPKKDSLQRRHFIRNLVLPGGSVEPQNPGAKEVGIQSHHGEPRQTHLRFRNLREFRRVQLIGSAIQNRDKVLLTHSQRLLPLVIGLGGGNLRFHELGDEVRNLLEMPCIENRVRESVDRLSIPRIQRRKALFDLLVLRWWLNHALTKCE